MFGASRRMGQNTDNIISRGFRRSATLRMQEVSVCSYNRHRQVAGRTFHRHRTSSGLNGPVITPCRRRVPLFIYVHRQSLVAHCCGIGPTSSLSFSILKAFRNREEAVVGGQCAGLQNQEWPLSSSAGVQPLPQRILQPACLVCLTVTSGH